MKARDASLAGDHGGMRMVDEAGELQGRVRAAYRTRKNSGVAAKARTDRGMDGFIGVVDGSIAASSTGSFHRRPNHLVVFLGGHL